MSNLEGQRESTKPVTGRPGKTPCELLATMGRGVRECAKNVVEKFWDTVGESREDILRRADISPYPTSEEVRAYRSACLLRWESQKLDYLPTGYESDHFSNEDPKRVRDIESARLSCFSFSTYVAELPKALVAEAIDQAILISRNPAIAPAYAEKMRARATDQSPANVEARKYHEGLAFNTQTTLAERKAGQSAPERQSSELTITDSVLANTALDILMDDKRIPQSIRDYLREVRHPFQDGMGEDYQEGKPTRQRCRNKNNLYWAILEYLSAVPQKEKELRKFKNMLHALEE